jgi:hypothetical protein
MSSVSEKVFKKDFDTLSLRTFKSYNFKRYTKKIKRASLPLLFKTV